MERIRTDMATESDRTEVHKVNCLRLTDGTLVRVRARRKDGFEVSVVSGSLRMGDVVQIPAHDAWGKPGAPAFKVYKSRWGRGRFRLRLL
jgi:hypothetical protein